MMTREEGMKYGLPPGYDLMWRGLWHWVEDGWVRVSKEQWAEKTREWERKQK